MGKMRRVTAGVVEFIAFTILAYQCTRFVANQFLPATAQASCCSVQARN